MYRACQCSGSLKGARTEIKQSGPTRSKSCLSSRNGSIKTLLDRIYNPECEDLVHTLVILDQKPSENFTQHVRLGRVASRSDFRVSCLR